MCTFAFGALDLCALVLKILVSGAGSPFLEMLGRPLTARLGRLVDVMITAINMLGCRSFLGRRLPFW